MPGSGRPVSLGQWIEVVTLDKSSPKFAIDSLKIEAAGLASEAIGSFGLSNQLPIS